MVEIARDLRQLIRAWSPELAVVEKFFFYRSSTTISVVQARGVLMITLARFAIPVMEFPPMQIKLALAGHGHAEKDDVLAAVMRELNLDTPPRPDDAADALAAALTGWFQRLAASTRCASSSASGGASCWRPQNRVSGLLPPPWQGHWPPIRRWASTGR